MYVIINFQDWCNLPFVWKISRFSSGIMNKYFWQNVFCLFMQNDNWIKIDPYNERRKMQFVFLSTFTLHSYYITINSWSEKLLQNTTGIILKI